MISIKNLTMLYKNGKGVKNISISIQDGETKALLGPNGSGKTTTMRSFMGFLKCSDGTLSVNEIDPISNPIEAKKIIATWKDEQVIRKREECNLWWTKLKTKIQISISKRMVNLFLLNPYL